MENLLHAAQSFQRRSHELGDAQIYNFANAAAGWWQGFVGLFFVTAAGMIPGVVLYVQLSRDRPIVNDTYEDIPGFTTGMSVVGSGLSFLLVFRLNWSFNRWWTSRGHLGTATTLLRDMAATATAGTYRFAMLDKEECNYKISPEQLAHAEKELQARRSWLKSDLDNRRDKSRTPSSKSRISQHRDAFIELCCQDIYWAAKGWFAILVDVLKDNEELENYEAHLDTSMKVFADMVAKGSKSSETAAHPPGVKGPKYKCSKVVVAHTILTSAVRRGYEAKILNHPEYQKCLIQLQEILSQAYGCLKIKTEPIPTPMTALSLFLLVSYTILFPIYMAYYFVAKLSAQAITDNYGLHQFPMSMYLFTTLLVLLFFGALRFIAQQMDDPFGDDPFDLRMIEFRNLLWGDIDTLDVAYCAMYKDSNSAKTSSMFLLNALKEDIHKFSFEEDEDKLKESHPLEDEDSEVAAHLNVSEIDVSLGTPKEESKEAL